ncbi:28 kda heat-and acid-stable phosphoprotein [Plakobranchus ocellatus]|uniref:28 kDa heat-and acid-stable phosphoprotein n=1 Tax=Plakobranchus ocellatus TaxID=259542 RepID=A0AAV4A1Q1_9GAST|nr:28 kda heat-and acid-stable phosphoprotein [Plakobranchus ocellatus]
MQRGGGRGGRGGKKNHKGQRRHFTDEDELREQAQKAEKEKAWRHQQGIESEEEDEDEARAKNRDMPPSESESESESEEEEGKPKGVSHLIAVENPNRTGAKSARKVTELGDKPTSGNLSRREREELEKQEARRKYQALHAAGKTEEAQADLARLAIIRKQREEAAKKKEEERKAKEALAAAKSKGKS